MNWVVSTSGPMMNMAMETAKPPRRAAYHSPRTRPQPTKSSKRRTKQTKPVHAGWKKRGVEGVRKRGGGCRRKKEEKGGEGEGCGRGGEERGRGIRVGKLRSKEEPRGLKWYEEVVWHKNIPIKESFT